jgi:hypothetical protein
MAEMRRWRFLIPNDIPIYGYIYDVKSETCGSSGSHEGWSGKLGGNRYWSRPSHEPFDRFFRIEDAGSVGISGSQGADEPTIGITAPMTDKPLLRDRYWAEPPPDQLHGSGPGSLSITTSGQRHRTPAAARAKPTVFRRGLGRSCNANRSARQKGASMWSRLSGSNRTPTANVAEAKRSNASVVH